MHWTDLSIESGKSLDRGQRCFVELLLSDHVSGLDALQGRRCRMERFEVLHRLYDLLDEAVILLDDVVNQPSRGLPSRVHLRHRSGTWLRGSALSRGKYRNRQQSDPQVQPQLFRDKGWQFLGRRRLHGGAEYPECQGMTEGSKPTIPLISS